MTFTLLVTSLAAFNALCVPLYLERQVMVHPSTASIYLAGEMTCSEVSATNHMELRAW